MKRCLLAAYTLLLSGFGMALLSPASAIAQTFTRGINANPWFTKPAHNRDGSFAYPAYPLMNKESYKADLVKMKQSGFDFIRLPVISEPIIHYTPEQRRELLENVRTVVSTALDVGLNILFDFHVVTGGGMTFADMKKDPAAADAYIELVKDAAKIVVAPYEKRVLFETMNEPTSDCADPFWKTFQRRIVESVWEQTPNVRMVLTGSCYSNVEGLPFVDLKGYAKPQQIYVSFHYYKPFWFTHQGASWAGDHGSKILTGVPWPARLGNYDRSMEAILAAGKSNWYFTTYRQEAVGKASDILKKYYSWSPNEKMIVDDFRTVAKWADDNGLPRSHLLLGEFGVLKVERKWTGSDMDSAARWISTVRQAAEEFQMPWAMWSYKEGMALAKTETGLEYYPELAKALGLKEVQ